MTHDEMDRQIKMAWERGVSYGLKKAGGSPDEVADLRSENERYKDLRQSLKQSFSLADFMAVKRTWEVMYDVDKALTPSLPK